MARLPEIANPQRKHYRSDLNNAEWEVLKTLVVAPKGFGHSVEIDFGSYSNRFFYVQRTGCQGEMMPHNRPALPCTDTFKNGNALAI